MKTYTKLVILLITLIPICTYAHPGRTDSSGCHTCRTNCSNWGLSSGEYHCHNAKAEAQPLTPIKSTYGESGTGYTTPAPEYSKPKQKAVQPLKTQSTKKEVSTTTKNIPSPTQPIISPIQPVESKSWFKGLFNWLF